MKLSDLAEPTERNDRAIQMALRETDTSVMAEFLAGREVPEREIIYRNMSDRGRELLTQEIAQVEGTVPPGAARRAEQFFLQRLSRFLNYTSRPLRSLPDTPPNLDFSSDEALVESLLLVSRYERAKGTLSLKEMAASIPHPVARKGLQLAVDGWDPVERRAILERTKETYLASVSRTIDILITGTESLGGDEHPLLIEERLKAFLPPGHDRQ